MSWLEQSKKRIYQPDQPLSIHNADSLLSFLKTKPSATSDGEKLRPGQLGGPNPGPINFEDSEILLANVSKDALFNKFHDLLNDSRHALQDSKLRQEREKALVEQERRVVGLAVTHAEEVKKWKASQANIEKTFHDEKAQYDVSADKREECLREKETQLRVWEGEIYSRKEELILTKQRYCESIIEYDGKKTQVAQLLAREQDRAKVAREVEEDDSCVICLDQPKSVALIPCGHWCICEGCSGDVRKCPICRKHNTGKLKIFKT
jgi:hypothetical protein